LEVSATGGDTVLAISGGAGDYNVNGGNPDTAATWTIDVISAANEATHTHAQTNHVHQWYNFNSGSNHQSYDSGGTGQNISSVETADDGIITSTGTGFKLSADQYTTSTGSGATGAGDAHTHTVTQDGSWRPSASVGKLYDLDTA